MLQKPIKTYKIMSKHTKDLLKTFILDSTNYIKMIRSKIDNLDFRKEIL